MLREESAPTATHLGRRAGQALDGAAVYVALLWVYDLIEP
jgi:hypothetical protein